MTNDFTYRTKCRMCGNALLISDLKLAPLPIGDRYVPKEQASINTKTYPLEIMRCENCGHYQNSGYVNPELIYPHYLSRPATTNTMLSQAYQEYAEYLLDNFSPSNRQAFSVETGSNDGAFSKYMQDKGARVYCIEPASNLVKQANDNGILTRQAYFNQALANEIYQEQGAADFFISNHMFANVEDSEDFIKGVYDLLGDTGVWSMQTFYHLDVLQKKLIENYTHEHLSYFYIKPFQKFCDRFDMELFDVKHVPAKEGSIRCFVQKKGGSQKIQSSVKSMIEYEAKIGIGKPGAQKIIADFIDRTTKKFHELLKSAAEDGKIIAGFGTSIGATTFVFNFNLGKFITFFVDDDPYRHNLISPGFHIPVLPSQAIYDKKADYVILLAPLYADIIMKKNQRYLEEGGTFIKFWPKFEIIEKQLQLI